MANPFLHAEWRKLLMVNYAIDPQVLKPFVPAHTELDLYEDTCYVSLVGFMFIHTRVKGIAIPFHQNFEEVNLRFYVKHRAEDGNWRRGVVFIKEIVPKRAITFVARTLYGEPYQTCPMRHHVAMNDPLEVAYQWRYQQAWQTFSATCDPLLQPIEEQTETYFITQHFWGYTHLGERKTAEYEVFHPVWDHYPVRDHQVSVDFGTVYGAPFEGLHAQKPVSVFLAEGSPITVYEGRTL